MPTCIVCLHYGLMKLNGIRKSLGVLEMMPRRCITRCISTFEPLFNDVGTFDWYMDNVSFVKEDGTWNYATYRRTSAINDPKD